MLKCHDCGAIYYPTEDGANCPVCHAPGGAEIGEEKKVKGKKTP